MMRHEQIRLSVKYSGSIWRTHTVCGGWVKGSSAELKYCYSHKSSALWKGVVWSLELLSHAKRDLVIILGNVSSSDLSPLFWTPIFPLFFSPIVDHSDLWSNDRFIGRLTPLLPGILINFSHHQYVKEGFPLSEVSSVLQALLYQPSNWRINDVDNGL